MKAKTYYMHPEAAAKMAKAAKSGHPHPLVWSRKDYPFKGVNVPFKVVKGSDVEKLIEKAARAMMDHDATPSIGYVRARCLAEAAFKSIGLLP